MSRFTCGKTNKTRAARRAGDMFCSLVSLGERRSRHSRETLETHTSAALRPSLAASAVRPLFVNRESTRLEEGLVALIAPVQPLRLPFPVPLTVLPE